MTEDDGAYRYELCRVLYVLAAPADFQARYLHEIGVGVGPQADELALEFDDLVLLLPQHVERGTVTGEESTAVVNVQRQLDVLQTRNEEGVWYVEALATEPAWAEVRRFAAKALGLLCGKEWKPRDALAVEGSWSTIVPSRRPSSA